jgi:prepilin-type N-terminal cleavage/methylation domain-containing protein
VLSLQRRRAGFTLIELLVVVVIIGILASVAAGSFANAQDKARNSAVLSGTRSVFMGIESFRADYNGGLPTELIGSAPVDGANMYLGADSESNASNFKAKYVPGGMLPRTPWADKPQEKMDSGYDNASSRANLLIGPKIRDGLPLDSSQGFFADGGSAGGGQPPEKGHGPDERTDFGYFYYCSDPPSGRYAVFGVGKYKKEPRVFSVKANYQ